VIITTSEDNYGNDHGLAANKSGEKLHPSVHTSGAVHASGRNSVTSGHSSLNDKQWGQLKVLVEKAKQLNFMDTKQTEILEKCIERREAAVLSVLAASGGNFTKFIQIMSLSVRDFLELSNQTIPAKKPQLGSKKGSKSPSVEG
jgi:hypothetical protein